MQSIQLLIIQKLNSGGLNTEHWNTKHIGILNLIKFEFVMVKDFSGKNDMLGKFKIFKVILTL